MDKSTERLVILILVGILVLAGLSGCAKPKLENKGPKQPTTLETIGKMKGIVSVLGCMFAPASEECKTLKSNQTPTAKDDQDWKDLDSNGN